MYRGYQHCVSLVVSLCCILLMLSLNTFEVKAATSNLDFSFSTTFYPNVTDSNTYGTISGGGGYLSNGTGSILSNSGSVSTNIHEGYSYHVTVPFLYQVSWTAIGASSNNYYDFMDKYFCMSVYSFKLNSSTGTISNLAIYNDNDNTVYSSNSRFSTQSPVFYMPASSLQSYGSSVATLPLRLEYDVAFEQQKTYGVSSVPLNSFDSNVSISISLFSRYATSEELNSAKYQVSDSGTQNLLNEQIQQENEAQNTREEMLTEQKSFFGSFFDNLIHVFVPDSGYFEDWFSRLNELLADKLGMLYAPFDLLITTLEAIYSADESDSGIPFPGIKWDDTWLVEPFIFSFDQLGDSEGISKLRDTVYFGTDVVLLFAFLALLENKIKEILEG